MQKEPFEIVILWLLEGLDMNRSCNGVALGSRDLVLAFPDKSSSR
jgi:hypothetical protein